MSEVSGLIGYVVVEYNQASGQPGVDYEDVHMTLADAAERLAWAKAQTKSVGRKEHHVIAALMAACKECGDPCELYDDGADGVCEACVMRAFAESG